MPIFSYSVNAGGRLRCCYFEMGMACNLKLIEILRDYRGNNINVVPIGKMNIDEHSDIKSAIYVMRLYNTARDLMDGEKAAQTRSRQVLKSLFSVISIDDLLLHSLCNCLCFR